MQSGFEGDLSVPMEIGHDLERFEVSYDLVPGRMR